MAIHHQVRDLNIEAVEEYFQAISDCLSAKKSDGGCLGYPAALLLFSVVNALGESLTGDPITPAGRHKKIGKAPFFVFNHQCFGLSLSEQEVKILTEYARNPLVHNALISPPIFFVASDELPEFKFASERIEIRLFSFRRLVESAWQHFDKQRLRAEQFNRLAKLDLSNFPNISAGLPIAASGCFITNDKKGEQSNPKPVN